MTLVFPPDCSKFFENGAIREHNFSKSSFTEEDVGRPVSDFDLTTADTSNVTNMSWMFRDEDLFNQDISDWDVSNVEDMSGMFLNTESFMRWMFQNAASFNQDLSQWDVRFINTVSNKKLRELCETGTISEDGFQNSSTEQLNKIHDEKTSDFSRTRLHR